MNQLTISNRRLLIIKSLFRRNRSDIKDDKMGQRRRFLGRTHFCTTTLGICFSGT